MDKKTFKIEEVLSAIYGILLCDIGRVYEVLNFVTGDNLFTHQLPRAGRQCQPLVEKQHPFLKEIDLSGINPENWKDRLAEIKAKYPNTIDLLAVNDWQHINPITEAIEMRGGDQSKVITINS
jgi:hypothetical protein